MDYSRAAGIFGIACICTLAASASPAVGGIYDRNWPSEGLVSRWSGEGNAKDSMGKHHGRAGGAVKYVKGVSGQAFKLDGRGAHINIGSPAGLRITGNQTIAMWLKPDRLGIRQNPLAKAVGGEGALTLEPDGRLTYYYGTSGQRSGPYDTFSVGPWVKVGKWIHIAIVRDFKARKMRCYINGMLRKEYVPKFTAARASSSPLYIGTGYKASYCGLIDEVCIWNRALGEAEIGAVAGSIPFAAPIVRRDAKLDSARPFDGSVLLGTIENQDWSITPSYGKFKIPTARVVGFLSKATAGAAASRPVASDVRMVLVDGHVLAGRLSAPLVRLKLPNGQVLKIPVAQIKQCGYRIGPGKPAGVLYVNKADERFPATALLRSGDHLAWDSSGLTIRFKSVCGMLVIRSETIATIAAIRGGMWRVNLKDHSSILGTMASAKLKLKLKLGKEISLPHRDITFLSLSSVIAKPADGATVLLRSGDRLVGKLDGKQLAVRTDYGLVDIPMADIWTIRRQADGKAELTMQKSTVLRGELTAGCMKMILGAGVKLSVPVDQIVSITFPRKLPTEFVRKIEALIKELGDPSVAKRKAAAQKLIAMGKETLVVLKRHSNSTNPTVKKGVKEVIDTLEGKRMILVKPEIIIQEDLEIFHD